MTETSETSDFSFSGRDFEELIRALSNMAGELSKEQWGLLLSIFAAAASNVEVAVSKNERRGKFSGVKIDGGVVITDPKDKGIEELRKQLQKAYVPGNPPGTPPNMSLGDMVTPPKPGK
jgi:hypothetical protein